MRKTLKKPPVTHKSCRRPQCSQSNPQPLSSFNKKRRYRNGVNSICKTCTRIEANSNRVLKKDAVNARARVRYAEDPRPHRKKARACRFKQKYWPHLTAKQAEAEWDRLYQAQAGRCAINNCEGPLDVDHDHTTGAVRALLCNDCNTAVARVLEDPIRAINVAEYIRKHKNAV